MQGALKQLDAGTSIVQGEGCVLPPHMQAKLNPGPEAGAAQILGNGGSGGGGGRLGGAGGGAGQGEIRCSSRVCLQGRCRGWAPRGTGTLVLTF